MLFLMDIPQIPAHPNPAASQLAFALFRAHYTSTLQNDNASAAMVRICNSANPGSLNGIASAILSLGKRHGPLREAREMWRKDKHVLNRCLMEGDVIPGYGNHFFKDGIDPAWRTVDALLQAHFPEVHQRLAERTEVMQRKSKTLWPNPAMYTAILCDILQVPDGQEHLIFLLARIPAWFTL